MTHSHIRILTSTFINTDYTECVAPDIAKCICSGNGTFLDLVACLETPLTSTEPANRAAGTQLLANVFHQLPSDFLTGEQLTFLCSFFIQRMKDHHTVLPAVLHASTALMQQLHISAADVEKFIRGLLLEVHCQSQLMMVRRNVYTTLRLCLTNHPTVVEEMFNEFVLGLVSAAEGERDPRNLLLMFSMVPLVAVSASQLGDMLEGLFEVVTAYFPIDFVPPSHDPLSVSTEDLVLALRRCLACTPAWAHLLVPLLLEKMESSLTAAKIDSYQTMSACCSVYNAPHVTEHLTSLWGCVRRDVVEAGGPDSEVTQAALSCLTDVTAVLDRGLEEVHSRDAFLDKVLEECAVHLSAPDSRLWEPASLLLAAVIKGSPHPANVICDKVLVSVSQQLKDRLGSGDTSKAAVNTVVALHRFLVAATHAQRDQVPASAEHQAPPEGVLSKHGARCVEVLSMAMSCPSSAVVAEAIATAHAAFSHIAGHHWHLLLQQIVQVLLSDGDKDAAVRANALSALSVPSEHSSELLSEHLLPLLRNDSIDVSSEVLDAVGALTRGLSAVEQVLPVLGPLLERHPTSQLCRCTAKILVNNSASPEVQQYLHHNWGAVQRLVSLGVSIALPLPNTVISSGEVEPLLEAVIDLGRAVGTLSSSLSSLAMTQALELLTVAAGGRPAASENTDAHKLLVLRPDAAQLWPVTEDNCESSCHLVFVLKSLLVCSREIASLPEGCLSTLLAWATQPSVPARCRLVAAQVIATMLNKMTGAPFASLEHDTRARVEALLIKGEDPERRQAAVALMGWITTALEMTAAPEARYWMDKLQSLLSDPVLGVSAARCYTLLLTDHPGDLSTKTFAKVRLLYKQRVFESVVGGLVSLFEASRGGARHCLLLALAALLADLPHSLLQQHMRKLVAVVVEGVRCTSEAAVVEGTVSTLHRLLIAHRPPPPELASHTGALVPSLLALAAASRRPGGGQVIQGHTQHKKRTESSVEDKMEVDQNKCDELIDSETVKSLLKLSDEAAQEELQLSRSGEDNERTPIISNSCIGSVKCSNGRVCDIVPPQPIKVRERSLQCLELLASLPLEDILPYKDQVIRGLKASVSDHKRVVRAAAAGARLAWMQAGS